MPFRKISLIKFSAILTADTDGQRRPLYLPSSTWHEKLQSFKIFQGFPFDLRKSETKNNASETENAITKWKTQQKYYNKRKCSENTG